MSTDDNIMAGRISRQTRQSPSVASPKVTLSSDPTVDIASYSVLANRFSQCISKLKALSDSVPKQPNITYRMRSWLAVGFVVFALILCGVAFSEHSTTDVSASGLTCNTACHGHGQPVSGKASTLLKQGEDDDKEPAPPYVYLMIGATALAGLYPKVRYGANVAMRPARRLYLVQACMRF